METTVCSIVILLLLNVPVGLIISYKETFMNQTKSISNKLLKPSP